MPATETFEFSTSDHMLQHVDTAVSLLHLSVVHYDDVSLSLSYGVLQYTVLSNARQHRELQRSYVNSLQCSQHRAICT
jgi:hypothetical protein